MYVVLDVVMREPGLHNCTEVLHQVNVRYVSQFSELYKPTVQRLTAIQLFTEVVSFQGVEVDAIGYRG